tara:strand:+ start:469 stop:915 length:447 start_codon:yes stop_codon:yes gene_type:complete
MGNRIKDIFIHLPYLVAGLILGAAVFFDWRIVLGPQPYHSVQVVSLERQDHWVHFHVTFQKTDCVFKKLVVIGTGFEATENLTSLKYDVDQTGKGTYARGDRIKGQSVWRFKVYAPMGKFENIEIRTRHDCDGETVDKVFLTTSIRKL